MNIILLIGILLRLPTSVYGGIIFSGHKYPGLIGMDFTPLCYVNSFIDNYYDMQARTGMDSPRFYRLEMHTYYWSQIFVMKMKRTTSLVAPLYLYDNYYGIKVTMNILIIIIIT